MAFKAMVSWLAFLLGHEDYEVRERTTRMLAMCDQWVVLTPFLEALEKEEDLEVRRRAERARFRGKRLDNWKRLAGWAETPVAREKTMPKRGVPTP